jgi:hypothetical protein
MPNNKKLKRLEALLDTFDSGAVQPEELIQTIDTVMSIIDQNANTLVDKIVETKSNTDSELSNLRTELVKTRENLQSVINSVKDSSDVSVLSVKKALLSEINRVEALIPVLPPETDLTGVFSEIERYKGELANLANLIVGENIRNALESLQGEDRLDVSAIRGLDERDGKLTNSLTEQAISIVDNRTSFLINKVSNLQREIDNISAGSGHTIEDEGTPLTQRTKLNFVGSGVTVTDDSGDDATVVTINGGGGGGTVETIVAGNNIDVDATDPANPIVSVETLTLADISDVTASVTEINYVDGVTSAIQTQLNTKLEATDIASGTITPRADDIDLSGGSDGDVLTVQADGSLALEAPTGGSGTPGGSTTQLQYNNAGAFGGVTGATSDGTNIFIPTLYGSSSANGDLTLEGTSNATKTTSYVLLQPTTGNVGVGTTTPGAKLDVSSATGGSATGIRLIQAAENASATVSYVPIDFTVPTTGLIGQFLATANNYSNAGLNLPANSVALLAEATSGTLWLGAAGASGGMRFNTGGYTSASERMRILSTGLIGIGTTAPDRALEINSATGINLRLTYNDSNGSAANYTDLLTTSTGILALTSSASVVEQRNSTTSQSFKAYKTYTDSSNYERLALNGTSTSGWVQVAAETAGTGTDNINIALTPAGTGGISAQVPDSGTGGGNARGARSVDFQTSRTNAAMVASGTGAVVLGGAENTATGSYAIAGGYNNSANSGTAAVALGQNNSVTGYYSVGMGYNNTVAGTTAVAFGDINTASGTDSWVPGGKEATTRALSGARAYAGGKRSAVGDAQVIGNVTRNTTTSTSTTDLTYAAGAVSSSNVMVLPNNSSAGFVAKITARNATNVGSGYWEVRGTIERGANAAATAIVGTTTVSTFGVSASLGTPTVDVVANTTQGAAVVQVTAANSDTTYWVADLELVQVA